VAVHAPQLLAALSLQPAASDASDGSWGYLIAAIGTLAATTIAAFGLFQILAIALGSRARTVDVHQIAAKPDREEETRDREEDYGDDG